MKLPRSSKLSLIDHYRQESSQRTGRRLCNARFQKGNKSLAANYRPISLTCILCKVLGHILASNIVKHLDGQGILYDLQHGFREKRSCETQLIMLIEDLQGVLVWENRQTSFY